MKITMYELLGLVKDGKAPKKIKYNTFELKRTMNNNLLRIYVDEEGMFFPEYYNGLTLNDIVEIIEEKEEKKIPEKLDEYADVSGDLVCNWTFGENKLKNKINEIIDYLKSKGE